MAEKDDVWSLMGLDEGGLPIHLPMAVTRDGQGPADASDAVKTVCWCQDLKCPVTVALREAHDLGRKDSREERHDAVRRLAQATAPLQWSMTGHLAQAVYLAESYIKQLEEQRDVLAQAMWDARKELGFDCDDNDTPGACIAGMGYDWFARSHVDEAKEVRKDLDDCLDELQDPLDLKAMAKIVVSLDNSIRQFPGDPFRSGSSRMKREQGRLAGALSCWEALTHTQGDEAIALARKTAQEG